MADKKIMENNAPRCMSKLGCLFYFTLIELVVVSLVLFFCRVVAK